VAVALIAALSGLSVVAGLGALAPAPADDDVPADRVVRLPGCG
jgi:hypothetical protein